MSSNSSIALLGRMKEEAELNSDSETDSDSDSGGDLALAALAGRSILAAMSEVLSPLASARQALSSTRTSMASSSSSESCSGSACDSSSDCDLDSDTDSDSDSNLDFDSDSDSNLNSDSDSDSDLAIAEIAGLGLIALNEVLSSLTSGEDAIHEGVQCDHCGERSISGARYKCCVCLNYDLCENCHHLNRSNVHDQKHIFMKFKTPDRNAAHVVSRFRDAAKGYGGEMDLRSERHSDVTCDKCGDTSIIGIRFKCIECNNFDLCASCESDSDFIHNKNHPLLVLSHPPTRSGHDEAERLARLLVLMSLIRNI